MEDQAEKMEALKKAYAEIILNTAKEAAARAMASECKALRFHHDLRNTKDEALQMLLRFKHMIDTTTTEAEMTSLSQQKRINELDAQLNETEEVIVDLRSELRKAHERLEVVKNSHILPSNEASENKHMDNSETTPLEKNQDITEQFRPSSQCKRSCNAAKENNLFIDNPKLASTIIGSKEPELYRNGYTHRIRAIERNLVDKKSISDDEPIHKICTKKDEILTENSEQNACTLRRSIRKRKVRCWDEISSLFKSRPGLSRCKNYSNNDGAKFNEHGHKSKSLAEMNQTVIPISPSTKASEETKYDENHKVSVKESSRVLSCKSIPEAAKVHGTDSILSTHGNDKNRRLKYTFSRTRKKDLSSKPDYCSSFLTNKMGEKTSLTPENEKPNLKEEPSSDSQSLVEVACQLISLSEQRSLFKSSMH